MEKYCPVINEFLSSDGANPLVNPNKPSVRYIVDAAYLAFMPLVDGLSSENFGKCTVFFRAILMWTFLYLTYCKLEVIGG